MDVFTAQTTANDACVFSGTVFATWALTHLFPEPFKARPVKGSRRWLRHRSTRTRGWAMAVTSVLLFCEVMLPLTWKLLLGVFLAAVLAFTL